MLVENGLYAIVSLPVGTFNPYSGSIKTSIVFFDKKIKSDYILHFQVEHDGFDLGRNRNAIKENDLPEVKNVIVGLRDNKKKKIKKKKKKKNDNLKLIDLINLFNKKKEPLQSQKNTAGQYTFITA